MNPRILLTISCAVTLCLFCLCTPCAQPLGTAYAPAADIAPRPVSSLSTAVSQVPQQQIMRTNLTLSEETQQICAAFSEACERAKTPRIMILFNRDLEDNDTRTMEKVAKITAAASSSKESSKQGSQKNRDTSVVELYGQTQPAPDEYNEMDLSLIQDRFERPFLDAGALLVDRDVAVRLSGIDLEAIFANQELPETKQGQVAAVKKHADIVVTAKVKRGIVKSRKVSGDYRLEAPYLTVRAISLKDAKILGAASTDDVKHGPVDEIPARVALSLMQKIIGAL